MLPKIERHARIALRNLKGDPEEPGSSVGKAG